MTASNSPLAESASDPSSGVMRLGLGLVRLGL
jgi:hypothetical protein